MQGNLICIETTLDMQQGYSTISRIRKSQAAFKALILFLAILFPTQSHAATMEKLKGLNGFKAAILAVAVLNQSMRVAADNPMDEWRRNNVAKAVQALPGAIRLLALEFKEGKLHDADLPMVQAILGGFVNVNAADGYKKFLEKPDKSLIPALGANFPSEALSAAAKSAPRETVKTGVTTVSMNEDAPKTNTVGSATKQLVTLKQLPIQISGTSGNIPPGFTASSSEGAAQLDEEIRHIEESLAVGGKIPQDSYSLKVKPQFWMQVPFHMLSLITKNASAGACKDCEEGGGGGGLGGFQSLMGFAAVMAGVAPVIGAAIQSNADQQINANNNATQLTLAQQNQDLAKYNADLQAKVAQNQSKAALDMNQYNKQIDAQKQDAQLAEMAASRQQQYQLVQEQRAQEKAYYDQKLALVKEQAQLAQTTAAEQFAAEVTRTGLGGGSSFQGAQQQGGQPSMGNAFAATQPQSQMGQSFGGGSPTGTSAAASASGFGFMKSATPTNTNRAFAPTTAQSRLLASVGGRGFVSSNGEIENAPTAIPGAAVKSKYIPRTQVARGVTAKPTYGNAYSVSASRATVAARGFTSAQTTGYPALSMGSTASTRLIQQMDTPKFKSDLASFSQESTTQQKGFATWRGEQQGSPVVSDAVTIHVAPSHVGTGAYNPPSDVVRIGRSVR